MTSGRRNNERMWGTTAIESSVRGQACSQGRLTRRSDLSDWIAQLREDASPASSIRTAQLAEVSPG